MASGICWICVAIFTRSILYSHGDRPANIQLFGRQSVNIFELRTSRCQICVRRPIDTRGACACIRGNILRRILNDD